MTKQMLDTKQKTQAIKPNIVNSNDNEQKKGAQKLREAQKQRRKY